MRHKMCLMAMVVLVGCSTEGSPVEKCDDLVALLCDRGVQCLGGSHAECVQGAQTTLPCGSAKAVSATYDRCVDQLESASCNVLFATNTTTGQLEVHLPADCRSVILMRNAPADDGPWSSGLGEVSMEAPAEQ